MDLQQLFIELFMKNILHEKKKKQSEGQMLSASLHVSWVPTQRLTDLGSILALAL